MSSLIFTLDRGEDAIDLEIEYEVAPFTPGNTWGPPEHCDPPEGGEVEELTAYLDGQVFVLSPAEAEMIEARIYETHNYHDD